MILELHVYYCFVTVFSLIKQNLIVPDSQFEESSCVALSIFSDLQNDVIVLNVFFLQEGQSYPDT